jgi:adenylate kinase
LKKKTAFILVGLPGCGKGTNGKRYVAEASDHPIHYIETGDLLRRRCTIDREFAEKWQPAMNAGKILPNHVLNELAYQKIDELLADRDFIFDGYPRTLGQAQYIVSLMREVHRYELVTVFFELRDKSAVIDRIRKRSLAESDPLRPDKPENEKHNQQVIRRADDKIEIVVNRIREFDNEFPTLDPYLRENTTYVVVSADNPPDIVFSHFSQHIMAYAGK